MQKLLSKYFKSFSNFKIISKKIIIQDDLLNSRWDWRNSSKFYKKFFWK